MRQLLLLGSLILMTACGGGNSTTTPVAVASVSLNETTATLNPQQSVRLVATTLDASGDVLSGRTVTWTSSALAVATVNTTGTVTAVALGTATITASSEGHTASATITVAPVPVATVTLNQSSGSIVPNQTLGLTATLKDAAGNTLSGRVVSWTSNATTTATVDNNGVVTGVAAASATITATSETKTASATITVVPGGFVTAAGGVATGFGSVTVTVPAGAVATGTAITIAPTANPPSDPSLAPGTAYDFGPAGTTFASPVSLAITYNPATLVAGTNQAQLRVAKLIRATWTALAGSTVNTTTHVATGATSSFSTYAVIAVPVPVATVTVTTTKTALNLNDVVTFTATAKDAQGNALTGRTVSWLSTAPAVATVSASGVVTAIAVGAATIQATSEGITGNLAITVTDPGPALLEQRVIAQQGLAIAQASTVLQSQFTVLFAVGVCQQAQDGSSYQKTGGPAPPMDVAIYYDGACTRPYMQEHVTVYTTNAGITHIVAVATYLGPTGTPLGTVAFDEFANLTLVGSFLTGPIYGLGTFTPANSTPSVSLGLNCALTANAPIPCQGGIVQNLPALGKSIGSVTSITLTPPDTSGPGAVSFVGTSVLTTGALNSLTLTAPQPLSLVVQGGTMYGSTSASGGEATFSLFPPTPTGWSVTDAGHDQSFRIDVASNSVRNLVGTITRISTGTVLASIAVDQSGTGTITYSDGTVAAITNWTLAQ